MFMGSNLFGRCFDIVSLVVPLNYLFIVYARAYRISPHSCTDVHSDLFGRGVYADFRFVCCYDSKNVSRFYRE